MIKRILIIGFGSIGRRHTKNLCTKYPDADFMFLRHQKNTDPLIEALGGKVTDNIDDALKFKPQMTVLATPSAAHMALLPTLIMSGLNLLVEKPIVTDIADYRQIKELIVVAPAATRMSGFNFRYLPSLIKAKEIIASSELGNIVRASLIAGQWLPDWREADYRSVYSASRERGGGVEFDLVHEIDVAHWFFGKLDLIAACCDQLSSLNIESNDVATMILRKPSGPIVHISLDYVSRKRIRSYEIVGDKGTLFWDINGTLKINLATETVDILSEYNGFDVGCSYLEMIDCFESLIMSEPGSSQSFLEGLESSKTAIEASGDNRQ